MSQYAIHSQPEELITNFFSSKNYSQIVVLVDANTLRHCYPMVGQVLPRHATIEVSAGEEYKTLETCVQVWDQLTRLNCDRHALVLVLGGGVLGDLGGFCAATYKRGIDFVLMPTTLLAQVDASIGGKLGIDFHHLKNHIGVFQQPVTTLISPAFLTTLPARELRSGFAEIIKHCLIADKKMWEAISGESLAEQDWEMLIRHSVEVKSKVITEDPKEKGIRKSLNFGHTIGHALESYFLGTNHRIFHGEAIAIGMIAESYIGMKQGRLKEQELQQIARYILKIFGKVEIPEPSKLLNLIYQDKKNEGEKILMALTKGIGESVWGVEVRTEEIESALSYYKSL